MTKHRKTPTQRSIGERIVLDGIVIGCVLYLGFLWVAAGTNAYFPDATMAVIGALCLCIGLLTKTFRWLEES